MLQTYKQLHPLNPGVIGSRSERVRLELREITPEAVIKARAIVESTVDDRGGNFMKLARAYRTLDIAEREG